MLAKFRLVRRFQPDESGQSLVEYGLIIMLIALVVAAILPSIGTTIANMFTSASNLF